MNEWMNEWIWMNMNEYEWIWMNMNEWFYQYLYLHVGNEQHDKYV